LFPFDKNICFASETAGYHFYGQDFLDIEDISFIENELNIRCYPNPCNHSTTIDFTIPKNENAKLEIYNLTGQKIIDFDITNKNKLVLETNSFISGIYFFKISTNKQISVKKFIVSK
jgi:hypothetical protein